MKAGDGDADDATEDVVIWTAIFNTTDWEVFEEARPDYKTKLRQDKDFSDRYYPFRLYSGHNITFVSVQEEDAGRYFCRVAYWRENGEHKVNDSNIISLTVAG